MALDSTTAAFLARYARQQLFINDPIADPPKAIARNVMNRTSATSLEELTSECAGCTICGVSDGNIGFGETSAKLFVIGGKAEARNLFEGESGELFVKMLGAIGLSRKQVYVSLIGGCAEHLEMQVAILRPDSILDFRSAVSPAAIAGVPVFATHSPAALLSDPAKKRQAWDVLKLLK